MSSSDTPVNVRKAHKQPRSPSPKGEHDTSATISIPDAAVEESPQTKSSPLQSSRKSDSPTYSQHSPSQMPSTPPNGPNGNSSAELGGGDNHGEIAASQHVHNGNSSNGDSQLSHDPSQPLEQFDWAGLSARYEEMMRERQEDENNIADEFRKLVEFFSVWAQTPATRDVERATKRLRTRVAHVQNSEARLEEKRQHYLKVVSAFQNALALLNGT